MEGGISMSETLSLVITSAIGLLGAVIGGMITARATKKQIEEEREQYKREKKESQQLNVKIVRTFLMNEINHNVSELQSLSHALSNDHSYFNNSYTFNKKFRFDEFDKVKYELLKYPSLTIKTTIELYQAFYLLDRKRDFKEYNKEEYDFIRKIHKHSYLMDLSLIGLKKTSS